MIRASAAPSGFVLTGFEEVRRISNGKSGYRKLEKSTSPVSAVGYRKSGGAVAYACLRVLTSMAYKMRHTSLSATTSRPTKAAAKAIAANTGEISGTGSW